MTRPTINPIAIPEKPPPLLTFSGHCDEGIVSFGAVLYCDFAWFCASESTSSFVDTNPTMKRSLPLTNENTSPSVLLDEYLK